MNQRISSILQTLKDGDTTINALAEQFQVSPRTIRNDLKEIDRLLRQNDLPDLSSKAEGKLSRRKISANFLPSCCRGTSMPISSPGPSGPRPPPSCSPRLPAM